MAYNLVAGTGAFNVDLTAPGKGKRLRNWHFSVTVAPAVIRLRDGSLTGPIVAEIQLAFPASASQVYPTGSDLVFNAGLFVEVASGGTSVLKGSVDI